MRVLLLFFIAFITLASAVPFSQVADYAKQYEAGQLSYLQFSVLVQNEKEKLFDELNAKTITVKIGEFEEHRGWDEATLRALFGEPTEMEKWAWSPNLDTSIRLEKPVPRWEETIYEGTKVRVTFNTWPQVIKREGETLLFYDLDLRSDFIEKRDFDIEKMKSEIKQLFENARNNGEKLREAAEKSVEFERQLGDYLRNNEQLCKETLKSWFGKEGGESTKLRWDAIVHDGEKSIVKLRGEEWTETNWHGFNSWVENEWRVEFSPESREEVYDFDYSSAGEYTAKVRETISELKRTAANLDSNPSSANLQHLQSLSQQYSSLVNKFNEKVGRRELEITQEELIKEFEGIFSEQREFTKENFKQVEFKDRLVNISKEVSGSYCSGEETSCGELQACVNAACVDAKGGNEQCQNSVDDDGDTLADCDDPDCFDEVSCGKKCYSTCSGPDKCWECGGQECKNECEACGQCNDNNPNNPEACSASCDSCGKCTEQKCSSKCETCWECEDEYYGGGCRSECKSCNECNENNIDGTRDCSAECLQCNKCNYEKGNNKCEPPKALDPVLFECSCPEVQCGFCEYQDYETCSCKFVQSCVPPSEERPNENFTIVSVVNETTAPQNVADNSTAPAPVQSTTVASSSSRAFSPLPYSLTGLATAGELSATSSACGGACSANQYCDLGSGWCQCQQGFNDCDGDWQNGCESTKECKQCKSNSDCAPSRCSEDNLRLVAFQCKQGEPWIEDVANAEFGGNCGQGGSEKFETGVWFSAWGEGYENFDQFKQQAWNKQDSAHCEYELQQAVKQRMEFQSSINDEFFSWFFNTIVVQNPNDFEKHVGSVWRVYDVLQRNSDDTARALRCLGRSDWPSEYVPINAEIKTDFGKVRIWEEMKKTSFWGTEQQILSPYMKMWVFPPKQVFKKFFAEKIREEGPRGPSPEELAMMRQWPPAMEKIKKIANAFGGDARIIVQVVDEGKPLVKFIFIVNERDLIRIEDAENYRGKVSATVSVSLDFVYDVASSVAKEMEGEHVQYPYWEEDKRPPTVFNDAVDAVKIFTRIFQGFVTGEISIQPPSALPSIIFILQEMMTMMMQAP